VLDQVRGASDQLEAVLASLDPDVLDGPVAADYVDAFARIERLAAAGKALAARRVIATGAWRHDGEHRDASAWMASVSGTSVGQAAAVLDTATRIEGLEATEQALRAGTLSVQQAALVADAATADPGAEKGLLERAGHDALRGLRTACARVKAAAHVDEMEHYDRIHRARSVRAWTDDDGAGRIAVRGPVDATARILAALRPVEAELFDVARKSEEELPAEAIAFDALVALAERSADSQTGGTERPAPCGPQTVVNVRVDRAALVRGHTEPGEVCEIAGVGPVPVAVVSQLLDDAIVRVLLVDGTDVRSVSHPGRFVPARMRTALAELFPECAIGGCHVGEHLEIDHNQPVEVGGPTAMWNLSRLCRHHHRHKHRHDLRLVGRGTDLRFVSAGDWSPPRRQ